MWQLMSASKDLALEQIYSDLLKQTSPHEKAIIRDLSRTFPNHEYFKEINDTPGAGTGQENLFNVVKAYSLYDEEVGYCQGLQFIVGPLLLNVSRISFLGVTRFETKCTDCLRCPMKKPSACWFG